jgi:hypothetical protein
MTIFAFYSVLLLFDGSSREQNDDVGAVEDDEFGLNDDYNEEFRYEARGRRLYLIS